MTKRKIPSQQHIRYKQYKRITYMFYHHCNECIHGRKRMRRRRNKKKYQQQQQQNAETKTNVIKPSQRKRPMKRRQHQKKK